MSSNETVWAGLVNKSGAAQLVCILDRGITVTLADQTIQAKIAGGSAHACQADEQFQLLRDGQSLFLRLEPPAEARNKTVARMRVQLGVVYRPIAGTAREIGPVAVTWEGTIQEAAALGRAITARQR